MTPSPSLRVLIRVDAGPEIGVGHAMRCATLAAALDAAGHRVRVVTTGLAPFVRDRFERSHADVTNLGDRSLDEVISDAGVDVCLIDGYLLGDDVRRAAATGVVVVAIDDNRELPVELTDVVVNQNLHAVDVDYPTDTGTRYLLGPDYALIRDDVVGLDRSSAGGGDVLVSFGGSDPKRLTLPTVDQVVQRIDAPVVVALSATHTDRPALDRLIERSDGLVRLADQNLTEAFATVDVAIIGGGSTLWEVAHLGIPTVAAIVADNQVDGSRAAEAAGFVSVLDCRNDDPVDEAARCVDAASALIDDDSVASSLAAVGCEMFDGHGPQRVVAAITDTVANRPT